MNEWIDISSILDNLLPITIDDIDSLDSNITSINIPDYSVNMVDYTTFNFSRFTLLEELIIGNDCFENVNEFKIDGLNHLKSLKIGDKSFTKEEFSIAWELDDEGNNPNRSFHILNCIELKSIEIGRYSFSDYGGGFELLNLPKLSTIKIGEIETDTSESNNYGLSTNFCYSSFVIKGIIDMILIMNRSSTFEFHWIRK